MTSYQRWHAAVHFKTPDRLPMACGDPELNDTAGAGRAAFESDWSRTGTGYGPWGIRWHKSEVHNLGQIAEPPLASWSDLADYPWPDPDRPELYEHIPRNLDTVGDKYVQTAIWMLLFERMWSLRGMDNLLTDFYLHPDEVAELADRIVDFQVRIVRNTAAVAEGRIHALGTTDDWGTQQGPIVSPALWHEFFLPRYKRIFDACHEVGWDVYLHSCGKVNDLVEGFIQSGVDMLNLQQPRLYGIEEIGRRFAGRVCFNTTVDIQATLPRGTDEQVRQEAAELLEHWATPEGGFIFNDYGDHESIGVSKDRARYLRRCFVELDPYSRRSR